MLSPNPNVAWVKGVGLIGIGKTKKEARLIADLAEQNIKVISDIKDIGHPKSIGKKNLFDMEYWSLEQAKLSKFKSLDFEGKIILITGFWW